MSNFVLACDALIINDKEEVLLQLRNNTKVYAHMWSTPGGKVEIGEKLEATLVREVAEEHDIGIQVIHFLQIYENPNPERHAVYFAYLTKIVKGTPKIMEPEKCSDLKWFPLNALPSPITPQAVEYVRTYLDSRKA